MFWCFKLDVPFFGELTGHDRVYSRNFCFETYDMVFFAIFYSEVKKQAICMAHNYDDIYEIGQKYQMKLNHTSTWFAQEILAQKIHQVLSLLDVSF